MKTHIKSLLNRKIDHSTQSHRTLKMIFLSVLFIVIATAAPIWSTLPEANATTNVKALIFRNIPSWSRTPEDEFEGVLEKLSIPFDVKRSREMADTDLSQYSFIVIPGAQWNTGYYADFGKYYERFEEYVKNGGTLVVEMNGAEEEGMKLPGGAYMVNHPVFNNIIIAREHPLVAPLKNKPRITTHWASHGYLAKVPKEATIIASEMIDGKFDPDLSKPTYVEYPFGKGRIIGGPQCFHDRDYSGRGPLMVVLVAYARDKNW